MLWPNSWLLIGRKPLQLQPARVALQSRRRHTANTTYLTPSAATSLTAKLATRSASPLTPPAAQPLTSRPLQWSTLRAAAAAVTAAVVAMVIQQRNGQASL